MDLPVFLYLLMEENYYKRNYARIARRILRDKQNPFEIPDALFITNYRLSKNLVFELVDRLQHFSQKPKKSSAIPFHLKVLATLHFLGNGSYQNSVGGSAWSCMSQPSISKAITEVCNLITIYLMPHWIRFPTTLEDKNKHKLGFYNKWGCRGIIGAIDGTHVELIAPPVTDLDHPPFVYINRKGKYSINVMIISDSNSKILAINARFPGSVHDAAIWQMSDIRNYLKSEFERGDKNSHLIGDSGYGLEPWLLTPFLNYEDGSPEELFNNMLKSARNVIERTNGILKGRFRCLLQHRVLNYHPSKAAYIIYSCAVLHNIALEANLPWDENDNEIYAENDNDAPIRNNNFYDNDILRLGRQTRNNYIALNIRQI